MKKIPIYHNQGIEPCNEIAWFFIGEKLDLTTPICADTTLFVDGSKPNDSDTIKCSSCDKDIHFVNVDGCGRNFI